MNNKRRPAPGITIDPLFIALRERREKLKLPLRIVAKRAGYDENTMWSWETGRKTPPLPRIKDWAQSLGMTLELREGSEP